jgi:nicotinamide riboside kinase
MATDPRRIVLTGPESTGKTTLAAALAQTLGTIWVPEFARGYAEAGGGVLGPGDVEPIARGQQAAENAALGQGLELVVFDTDLVSTALYARHYYRLTVDWIEAAIESYGPSLYLLCDIDLGWSRDPVRDRGGRRDEIHRLFEDELLGRGIEPVLIRGHGPSRYQAALEAVEWFLRHHCSSTKR